MNKFYKASVIIFTGAIGLAGCNEQAPEPSTKVEVSKAATPITAPVVVAPVAKAVIAPTVVAPPKPYEATLAEGIDFTKPSYPTFIAEVTGLSMAERWGRWSDATLAPVVKFRFEKKLPKKFTLEIVTASFAPAYSEPVKVQLGDIKKTFFITNKQSNIYSVLFETNGKSDTLIITPPKPVGPINDPRKLSIPFVSLKIKE